MKHVVPFVIIVMIGTASFRAEAQNFVVVDFGNVGSDNTYRIHSQTVAYEFTNESGGIRSYRFDVGVPIYDVGGSAGAIDVSPFNEFVSGVAHNATRTGTFQVTMRVFAPRVVQPENRVVQFPIHLRYNHSGDMRTIRTWLVSFGYKSINGGTWSSASTTGTIALPHVSDFGTYQILKRVLFDIPTGPGVVGISQGSDPFRRFFVPTGGRVIEDVLPFRAGMVYSIEGGDAGVDQSITPAYSDGHTWTATIDMDGTGLVATSGGDGDDPGPAEDFEELESSLGETILIVIGCAFAGVFVIAFNGFLRAI